MATSRFFFYLYVMFYSFLKYLKLFKILNILLEMRNCLIFNLKSIFISWLSKIWKSQVIFHSKLYSLQFLTLYSGVDRKIFYENQIFKNLKFSYSSEKVYSFCQKHLIKLVGEFSSIFLRKIQYLFPLLLVGILKGIYSLILFGLLIILSFSFLKYYCANKRVQNQEWEWRV